MSLFDSHSAGGAAMAGGQRFQARVTVWWCLRMLLQTQVGRRYDLSASSIPELVYCETTDKVDDLRIELSGKEQIFGQCKRSLSLSSSAESEWASVLKQFFEELKCQPSSEIERRLVLFYEKNNEHLKTLNTILVRYR